jgi:hypothetical protein
MNLNIAASLSTRNLLMHVIGNPPSLVLCKTENTNVKIPYCSQMHAERNASSLSVLFQEQH